MTPTYREPSPDAIVAGIHLIREQLLAEHKGDLQAYFESARRRQYESGQPLRSEPLKSEKLAN
jgi:hypothetical protein